MRVGEQNHYKNGVKSHSLFMGRCAKHDQAKAPSICARCRAKRFLFTAAAAPGLMVHLGEGAFIDDVLSVVAKMSAGSMCSTAWRVAAGTCLGKA